MLDKLMVLWVMKKSLFRVPRLGLMLFVRREVKIRQPRFVKVVILVFRQMILALRTRGNFIERRFFGWSTVHRRVWTTLTSGQSFQAERLVRLMIVAGIRLFVSMIILLLKRTARKLIVLKKMILLASKPLLILISVPRDLLFRLIRRAALVLTMRTRTVMVRVTLILIVRRRKGLKLILNTLVIPSGSKTRPTKLLKMLIVNRLKFLTIRLLIFLLKRFAKSLIKPSFLLLVKFFVLGGPTLLMRMFRRPTQKPSFVVASWFWRRWAFRARSRGGWYCYRSHVSSRRRGQI